MDFKTYYHFESESSPAGTMVFYVAFALLVVVLGAYGLLWGRIQVTQRQIRVLDEKMSSFGADQSVLRDRVLAGKQLVDTYSDLLSRHVYVSHAFDLVEKNLVPGISFSGFVFSGGDGSFTLSGRASDVKSLNSQIVAFSALKNDVESAALASFAKKPGGKLDFSVKLIIKTSLISYGE